MKVVIIDDENRTRNLIRKMVESFGLDVTCNAEGQDLKSGLKVIQEEDPDIVLLDIQMPDGSGFDLLNLVENKRFKVIFITAHEEFAIKAIKFSAFDYILKPVDADELEKTLKKAITEIKEENQFTINDTQYAALSQNIIPKQKQRLVLKTQESIYVVDLKDIIRCEADRNYTSFYLHNKTKILVSKTLKEYDLMLTPFNFLRVQQSHLINLDYVDRYDKGQGGAVVMKDGSQVPLSQSKREIFFSILEQL
jgi:two-component system LytT family response regulator